MSLEVIQSGTVLLGGDLPKQFDGIRQRQRFHVGKPGVSIKLPWISLASFEMRCSRRADKIAPAAEMVPMNNTTHRNIRSNLRTRDEH